MCAGNLWESTLQHRTEPAIVVSRVRDPSCVFSFQEKVQTHHNRELFFAQGVISIAHNVLPCGAYGNGTTATTTKQQQRQTAAHQSRKLFF
jgi:hypothetical protein